MARREAIGLTARVNFPRTMMTRPLSSVVSLRLGRARCRWRMNVSCQIESDGRIIGNALGAIQIGIVSDGFLAHICRMAKRSTVFYSWQSDSPSNLNRSFIERALQEAMNRLKSDATLENALRDRVVELDKDTQGVAGSPPIAQTILQKIKECAVFVADLSFVGESKNGFTNASGKPRQFPNPNVLIEWGYALQCHSHSNLVGIMNTAYGRPDDDSLPFDLRHLRWPISYHLADSSAADKNAQFEKLVNTLVKAIGLILSNHSSPSVADEKFIPQKPTKTAAVYFDAATDLVIDRSGTFTVPDGAKAYLRLYPFSAVPAINSELEAKILATNGNLQPMGRVSGWGIDRNIFGAIAHEPPRDDKLCHFTQLFLSREIWGVDANVVNADRIREWLGTHNQNNLDSKYIANQYLEEVFVGALHNFLIFAQTHLRLPLPLKIEAGLVGIKDYSITTRDSRMMGKSLRDVVQWPGELTSYGKPAWEILTPFFDRIWDNCGFQRSAQQQAELVKRFVR
jgi:hypothetical protein